MAALDPELDDRWRADRDDVIADMHGAAVFLLAALRMRLTLSARRCGVGAEAAVDVLLRAMGLPEEVREAAWAVRRPDLEDTSLPPWQMWCVTAPGIVYHRICDDKSARTFKDLLGDYQGWVVADALGTHQAGARECRGLKLAACWAHVLRRFRDAVVDFPEAQFMLAWIQDHFAGNAARRSAQFLRRPTPPRQKPTQLEGGCRQGDHERRDGGIALPRPAKLAGLWYAGGIPLPRGNVKNAVESVLVLAIEMTGSTLRWRGAHRAVLTSLLAAALTTGCGPTEQQPMHTELSNQGKICLYPAGENTGVPAVADTTPRSYAIDQPVNIAVQFPGCLSSSCTQDRMASCTVAGASGALQVTSSGTYTTINAATCTTDCGFLIARCQTPALPAGTTTFQHGTTTLTVTLPFNGPAPCAGDPVP